MTITAQNIAFDDNLESAKMVKLGWNLCQNNRFIRNITDFCRNTDNDGDAKFSRVTRSKLAGGTALKCSIYSTPSASTRVRHDIFVGAIADASTLHVAFDAVADSDKVVDIQLYHVVGSSGRAAAKSVTVTTNPETHYTTLLSTSATTSGFVSFLLGADATNITISNIRIYREEDSVTLPRFQSVSLASTKGVKSTQSIDGRNAVSRMLSNGSTNLSIVDPFVDSDPMFWEHILRDQGREWQEGMQYLDGDFMENPSGLWTVAASEQAWESSTSIVGSNSVSVIGNTTTAAFPFIRKLAQDSIHSRNLHLTAWVRCATGTLYDYPAGTIQLYDGISTTLSTYRTLTNGGWIKTSVNMDTHDTDTTPQAALFGKPSATDNKVYFDAVKLEQDYQSPFLPQPTAHLWALKIQYKDGTYRYTALVPRIRWATLKLPMAPSRFLTQSIAGTGDQLLMSRTAL